MQRCRGVSLVKDRGVLRLIVPLVVGGMVETRRSRRTTKVFTKHRNFTAKIAKNAKFIAKDIPWLTHRTVTASHRRLYAIDRCDGFI